MFCYIKCVTFRDIHSTKQGSVFDIENLDLIEIESCSFNSITSTTFPGCFRIQESTVNIKRCSFADCSGVCSGNDVGFGNAFLCQNCYESNTEISAVRCPSEKTQYADSCIGFISPKSFELSFFNASDNYGRYGSASFTFKKSSDIEQNKVNFTTIVNANDYDALEIEGIKYAYIYFFNMIDTKNCISSCLSLSDGKNLNIYNSIFINPKNPMCDHLNELHFYNCYTNDKNTCSACEFDIGSDYELIDVNYVKTCNNEKLEFFTKCKNNNRPNLTLFITLFIVPNILS